MQGLFKRNKETQCSRVNAGSAKSMNCMRLGTSAGRQESATDYGRQTGNPLAIVISVCNGR